MFGNYVGTYMTPVSELSDFLPHSGELVWIDAVISADAEGGVSLVVVDEKKHYCDSSGVRQSSFIEWMAQGFGFVNALLAKDAPINGTIKNAFLVGFNNVTFGEVLPKAGEALLITTLHKRTIGPISYIEGTVTSRDTGLLYCEGQIKLFSN
jgi:predicted hotdog family 3-hydroxylacyl-ACP dehydratase